jgi:hydrogenase expression/formation protein HypE
MKKSITLAQGNGGAENHALIKEVFWRHLGNEILDQGEDAALLEALKRPAFTTDSFTVSPLFFPGGDIGKLSVCGTCNDLAMMGAKPHYLSLSVVIEEGFEKRVLEKIVRSIKKELTPNDAIVVSGDTKVVPKGSVDGLFITTSGIGERQCEGISIHGVRPGDAIVVSRDIGRHGAAIFAAREGMELQSSLESDCASLWPQVASLLEAGIRPHALRDATRGGLAAVLNEWAEANDLCIEIDEEEIPVSDEVRGICELLGFEPAFLANEGTFVLALDPADVASALEILEAFEGGEMAMRIGEVRGDYPGKVVLNSPWGTRRFLDWPTGELLPRIC